MSSWDTSNLMQWHGTLSVECDQCMSTLVVSSRQLLLVSDKLAFALGTHDDTILCPVKVLHIDKLSLFLRGLYSSLTVSAFKASSNTRGVNIYLLDHVLQISTRETRCSSCKDLWVYLCVDRDVLHAKHERDVTG